MSGYPLFLRPIGAIIASAPSIIKKIVYQKGDVRPVMAGITSCYMHQT
jgi:hypothetical protein